MNITKFVEREAQKLQAYMRGRLKYFAELNYPVKPSTALLEHSAKNSRNAHTSMSVLSSATSMAPCQEAIEAAAKAGKHFQDQTNDVIVGLKKQRRELVDKASELSDSYIEYTEEHDDTDMLGYTPSNKLLGKLSALLANVPKEYRDYMCATWEGLDPAIAEHMEHFGDSAYTLKTPLPTSQKEKGRFNDKVFKFMGHAIEIMFEGFVNNEGHEMPSLINPPINTLDELIAAERRKIEAQLHCDDIVNERLKPQIVKNLKNLHGIPVSDMSNISTCHGTNTTIVTSAIASLIKTQPGKDKLLLQFSMSWDNYKSYEAGQGLRHHFIDGPVTAKGLEIFIQKVVLEGRTHNPEHAKRVVSAHIGGLLISIPENPTGNNLSADERKALIDVIVKYDIKPVILDEIYAVPGCKSLSTEPGMEGRCYVVAGTSKYMSHNDKMSFGYSGNPEYAAAVERAIPERVQLTPRQAATFAAFLEHTPLSYHEQCEAAHRSKRDVVSAAMQKVNQELGMDNAVSWLKTPQSGRLGVICVAPELATQCGIQSSTQFAEYLFKMGGVEGLPLGDANANARSPKGIRVNFSKSEDFLVNMVERIGIAAKHMQEKVQYSSIEGKKHRGSSGHEIFQHASPFASGSFVVSGASGGVVDIGSIAAMFNEMREKLTRQGM